MRRAVAILSSIVLGALAAPVTVPAGAPTVWTAAAATAAKASPAVSISIDSMSPQVPRPSYHLHPLRLRITVQNLTENPLEHVRIQALRAEQAAVHTVTGLQQTISHPPTTGTPVPSTHPVTMSLGAAGAPNDAVTTLFTTTVGLPTTAGFCLCDAHALIPLVLQAVGSTGSATGDQVLGASVAFVPSFYSKPAPVQVGWVWPLIDRPHRLARSDDFLDDDLAASVAYGRLERCLQVLERVAPHVPVTVVMDPELLDELQLMATTHYRYYDAAGKLVPGTGSAAAQEWLNRLQQVVQNNPDVSVALTPLADPDIQSLARAGLSWSAGLSDEVQKRVATALGGIPASTSFAWPPSGLIGHSALSSLYGSGYRSLLLSSDSVRRQTGPTGLPVTLARLPHGGHPVIAALTSPQLQANAAAAMTLDQPGENLSELLAGIAVRLAQQPGVTGQSVVLSPPRYVDPDVGAAVTAVLASSKSLLTQPVNVLGLTSISGVTAGGNGQPAALTAQLAPPAASARVPGLPHADLRAAHVVSTQLASLHSLFRHSLAAQQRLDDLAGGVQRIESAAWRPGSGVGGRPLGAALALELRRQVEALIRGVHIITPPSRSYTLASTNSPLLITVENDLPYPASIKVSVRTVNGVPGLDAGSSPVQDVQPHSKATLHVPTQVQRSGRIKVRAVLLTPSSGQLGAAVPLTVNSTALGTIGVVITIVSGAVLLLALLVRLVRRILARRRRPPSATPWLHDDDPDNPMPSPPAGRRGPRTPETVPPTPRSTP